MDSSVADYLIRGHSELDLSNGVEIGDHLLPHAQSAKESSHVLLHSNGCRSLIRNNSGDDMAHGTCPTSSLNGHYWVVNAAQFAQLGHLLTEQTQMRIR